MRFLLKFSVRKCPLTVWTKVRVESEATKIRALARAQCLKLSLSGVCCANMDVAVRDASDAAKEEGEGYNGHT